MTKYKNMTVLGAVFTGLLLQSGAFATPLDPRCPLNLDKSVLDLLKKDPARVVPLNVQGVEGEVDFFLRTSDQVGFKKTVGSSLNVFAKPFNLIKTGLEEEGTNDYLTCTYSRAATLKPGEYQFTLRTLLD